MLYYNLSSGLNNGGAVIPENNILRYKKEMTRTLQFAHALIFYFTGMDDSH